MPLTDIPFRNAVQIRVRRFDLNRQPRRSAGDDHVKIAIVAEWYEYFPAVPFGIGGKLQFGPFTA
jgi:hypothetical protein